MVRRLSPEHLPGCFLTLHKRLTEGHHAAHHLLKKKVSSHNSSLLLRPCFGHAMPCHAGCKHDAGMFEELLKEYCLLDPAHSLGNTMIDSACLNTPKVTS